MLNDANLFVTDLFARLDIITSVMTCRPIKKVTQANHISTPSPEKLVHPLLSRQHVRQNLLYTGKQLLDTMRWINCQKL